MIKNVVFDMGNVLFDFTPDLYLEKLVENEEDRATLKKDVFQSLEWLYTDTGEMTVKEACESVQKRVEARLHGEVEKLFFRWIDYREPNEDMQILIRELKEKGYKIYLLSNTSEYYYNFRDKITAIDCFDGEFISAEHKVIKPYPEIYIKFFDLFSLNADECFFVDDIPLNIRGALKTGMHGAVYHGDINRLRDAMKKAKIL